jgi:nucleotide-binding universal stress UspA family protein
MMRIVAGLDDTRPSTIAQRLLTGTRWPPGSLVRVVTAEPSTTVPMASVAVGTTDRASAVASPHSTGLDVELAPVHGSGTSVLLDAARAFGADLIVVGGHEAGDPDDGTHGLELDLVSRTSCPVLVARSSDITRILLAVDGSRGATALPRILGGWQAFDEVPVDVVSVVPVDTSLGGFVTPWAPFTASDEGRESRIARHQRIARRTAQELALLGWAAIASVRVGEPAPEIVAAAEDLGADLIVVASRGHHIERPPHLGSVAGEVLRRSPVSVLLIGPAAIVARRRPVAARMDTTVAVA